MQESSRLHEIIKVFHKHEFPRNRTPENIRCILEELGPTFIKIGQILSGRNDFVSEEYRTEFKKLLTAVKPMDFENVKSVLNEEFENYEDVFASVDEVPLGSASIAQTHHAVLKDGTEVAVKILRSGIKDTVATDMKLIRNLVKVLRIDKFIDSVTDVNSLIEDLEITLNDEMNLLLEAQHMEEFSKNNSGLKYIKVPEVYHEYTTSDVLTMEYIGGFRINECDKLKEAGYDIHEIGEKLADNYVKQVIDDGYYHSDPHAGNIKIEEGSIVYLDFGETGYLSAQNQKLLGKCIKYILDDNYREITNVLCTLNTSSGDVDFPSLNSAVKSILDKNKTISINDIDIKDFISDLMKILSENGITLPRDISMLARSILTFAGLLEEICPEISIAEVFRNYYLNNPFDSLSGQNLKKQLVSAYMNMDEIVGLPVEVLTALKGINNNELKFGTVTDFSKKQKRIQFQYITMIVLAILGASLIISYAMISALSYQGFLSIIIPVLILADVVSLILTGIAVSKSSK